MNFKRLFRHPAAFWTIRAAITVIFVSVVTGSLSKSEIAAMAASIRPQPVLYAFLLGMAGLFLQVLRWKIILEYQSLPSSLIVASRTILSGALLAFITPGRVGEFFRGMEISEKNKADTVIAVFVDKVFIVLSVFLTAVFCAFIQAAFLKIALPKYASIMILSSFIVSVSIIIILIFAGKVPVHNGGAAGVFYKIMSKSPFILSKTGLWASILSFMAQAICLIQTVILVRMFVVIPWKAGIAAVGQAYAFMAFVPFSIANIGVREYSFNLFLSNALPSWSNIGAASIGASTGILVINLIVPALSGLIWNLAGSSKPTVIYKNRKSRAI